MNALGIQSTIKPLVTMILKNGKIESGFHPRLLSSFHQLFVVLTHFVTQEDSFFLLLESLESLIVSQFLSAGLDGEIGLTVGDYRY